MSNIPPFTSELRVVLLQVRVSYAQKLLQGDKGFCVAQNIRLDGTIEELESAIPLSNSR